MTRAPGTRPVTSSNSALPLMRARSDTSPRLTTRNPKTRAAAATNSPTTTFARWVSFTSDGPDGPLRLAGEELGEHGVLRGTDLLPRAPGDEVALVEHPDAVGDAE